MAYLAVFLPINIFKYNTIIKHYTDKPVEWIKKFDRNIVGNKWIELIEETVNQEPLP